MNKSTNQQNYKKPTLFQRIAHWIDKPLGIKEKDYLTEKEARYVNENFNKAWRLRRKRESRSHSLT